MLLAACGTTGGEIRFVDTACHNFAPIFVSQHDEFTDITARQILTHNEAYEALCGSVDAAGRFGNGGSGAEAVEP